VTCIIHNVPAGTTTYDLLTAALRYAAIGWPVFPCAVNGKTPATPNGCLDATIDAETIRGWWSATPWNVAIATGAPGPDVVDVDTSGEGSGWAAYERLKRAGLLAGAVALVRTRSGGLHVYFAGTTQRNTVRIGNAALDFRGQGGYVIAPPSYVEADDKAPGGAYEVLDHRQGTGRTFSVTAARELLDPPRPRRTAVPVNGGDVGALAAWVAAQPEGNRNAGLYWAACKAVEGGAADLEPFVEAAQSAGLSEAEARATVQSAARGSR
jgi:hypothetical protein